MIDFDDKDLGILAIALITLAALLAAAFGVESATVVAASVSAIAGLAVGRKPPPGA